MTPKRSVIGACVWGEGMKAGIHISHIKYKGMYYTRKPTWQKHCFKKNRLSSGKDYCFLEPLVIIVKLRFFKL